MSTVRRRFCLLALAFSSLILVSCGGGSGGQKISAQPPIFTSTPVTAAAQGAAYSYQVAATDPSGGTVSYALTTGPTGASLSGSNVSWTPTAAQSRTPNSFTVTATTSENATATQSWTVSPTGIVTVNAVDTFWEPTGAVQVPIISADSLDVSAVVPEPDGSLTVLKGAATGAGVFSIAGVPAGNYWLAFGTPNLLPQASSAYWTNTTTFDAGRDIAGSPPVALSSTNQTNFAFSLSGLASVNVGTPVFFNPAIQTFAFSIGDPANTTSVSATMGVASNIDWSKVGTAFLAQYEPATLGQLAIGVAGPSATLSGLSFTNGTTNPITQSLQAGTATSYDVSVQGAQWASTFTGAAPATPSSYSSGFYVQAEPFVSGVNAPTALNQVSDLVLAATVSEPVQGLGFAFAQFTACDSPGFPARLVNTQPSILTDVDLGTLQYDDSFPSTWTRAENFCEEAIVPVPVPGSAATANFALVSGATVTPSGTALAPVVGPVQSPTINGASLFSAATLTATTPALSWSAPTIGSPYGYRVTVYVLANPSGVPVYETAGIFYTSQPSVTLPPLSAGNTYVFSITALTDGTANVQTAPFRSSLPTGYASVVSAPITISSGAAQVRIHGDARVIKQFSQPKPAPVAGSRETYEGGNPALRP